MRLNVLQWKKEKLYRYAMISLFLILILNLIPITLAIADELGGYVSEKLIGRSGVSDSRLVISRSNTSNSFLDIANAAVEGIVNPNMNPDSGAYQLNALIPLILMGMFIIMLLGFLATGEFTFASLIAVVVLIYFFYSFLPGIQTMITNLLGG
jgi:hypothetical protein